MANYTVTTLADETFQGGNETAETGDGAGLSLREALALANGNGATPIPSPSLPASPGERCFSPTAELGDHHRRHHHRRRHQRGRHARHHHLGGLRLGRRRCQLARARDQRRSGDHDFRHPQRPGHSGSRGACRRRGRRILVGEGDALDLSKTTVTENVAGSGAGISGDDNSSLELTNVRSRTMTCSSLAGNRVEYSQSR